jgi:hypothetical protein
MRVKMYSFGKAGNAAFLYRSIVADDATLERELENTVEEDMLALMDTEGLINMVLHLSYFMYELHYKKDKDPHYILIIREDSPYFNVDCFTEKIDERYNQRRSKLRRDYFVPLLAKAHTSDPDKHRVILEDEDE